MGNSCFVCVGVSVVGYMWIHRFLLVDWLDMDQSVFCLFCDEIVQNALFLSGCLFSYVCSVFECLVARVNSEGFKYEDITYYTLLLLLVVFSGRASLIS